MSISFTSDSKLEYDYYIFVKLQFYIVDMFFLGLVSKPMQ